MNLFTKLKIFYVTIKSIAVSIDKIRQSLGRIESRQLSSCLRPDFNYYEFQVYSQWGEDGLIQYLINKIEVTNKIFIEFGVEKYTESNTRYLLTNNNWSGLIIDGSSENIEYIKRDPIYWMFNLKAINSFVDTDNINSIIKENGLSDDIGLLSIDIDGNDYFLFEKLNVVKPRIIICEYNSLWGNSFAVSVPYDPKFIRTKAHYSNLYFGASITALTKTATEKGYSLVGSNATGVNIFFIRNDLLGDINVVTPKEAWVEPKFRESRNPDGELTFLPYEERLALLSEMPLINFDDGKLYKVGDLFSSIK